MYKWWLTLCALLLAACGAPESPQPTQDDLDQTQAQQAPDRETTTGARQGLRDAIAGEHRTPENRARDRYRNPVDTLKFFGFEPDQTVVEIWPGGGWYTEILAPALRDTGTLIAANFPADPEAGMVGRIGQRFVDKLEANEGVYGQVQVVTFAPPEMNSLGEPESADLVLLSRHFHNLIARDQTGVMLEAAYEVLRSGGVLGIVQHRAPPEATHDPAERTGYVPEAVVIEAAQEAGFTLDQRSEINANPLDTADHAEGVWALPPTLAGCHDIQDEMERSSCRERYEAIGESDRMTLRFLKP